MKDNFRQSAIQPVQVVRSKPILEIEVFFLAHVRPTQREAEPKNRKALEIYYVPKNVGTASCENARHPSAPV